MAMSVRKHGASLLNLSMRVGYVCVFVLLFGRPSAAASEVRVWTFDQDSQIRSEPISLSGPYLMSEQQATGK